MPSQTFSSTHQPARRTGRTCSYDLDALHRLLWGRADPRRHQLAICSVDMAAELYVHDRVLRRCLSRLMKAGQLRYIERDGRARVFVVSPPP